MQAVSPSQVALFGSKLLLKSSNGFASFFLSLENERPSARTAYIERSMSKQFYSSHNSSTAKIKKLAAKVVS